MIVAIRKDWEAASILITLKYHNLVRIKDLNKYGRIISSGHGFYTVKVIEDEESEESEDIKCRKNRLIFL